MTASLKQLEGLQEELSEALAPSDVKQLSQKMWLLWQKHSDLKHKLSIRLQILKVKTERVELFNMQHSHFSEWLKKTEQKLRKNDDNIVDLLTRYENIYKDEIDLKGKELQILNHLRDQIIEEKGQNICSGFLEIGEF